MTNMNAEPVIPAVSIIGTAYNTADYLPQAVQSVLTQTFPSFELILVDDGSSDSTYDLAQSLARTDPRITVIRHERNLGAGPARNTGLRLAKAPFITFLDTDDVWENRFLEEMLRELNREGDSCAGVFCAYRYISQAGDPLGIDIRPAPGHYDLLRMLEGICPPGTGSALMIRKACFDEVGEFTSLEVGQDAEMWLRIVAESCRKYLYCFPEYLVLYRRRENSLLQRSHQARQASFEYRIHRYLPQIAPSLHWKVYSAFARLTGFAGPGLTRWRKRMARKALCSGGLRLLRTAEGKELLAMALWGQPKS